MAKTLTFTRWLEQHRREDTAFGDFARAVARDTEWQDPGNLTALESQLQGAGCSQATLETARRAWRRYVSDSATRPGAARLRQDDRS